MFTIGLLNRQNKANMSFNQDINFHRAAKHLRSSKHTSPQRMLSCPNPGGMVDRFKSAQTGSTVSLNSACSSKDEGSSGENSDHNQHNERTAAFDRNESLQSSFNSEHSLDVSSAKESDTGGGDDSPVISDVRPFTKSTSTFAMLSSLEPHNNNLIEMNELKGGHLTSKNKKKKKIKKPSKHSSSASSVGKFLHFLFLLKIRKKRLVLLLFS